MRLKSIMHHKLKMQVKGIGSTAILEAVVGNRRIDLNRHDFQVRHCIRNRLIELNWIDDSGYPTFEGRRIVNDLRNVVKLSRII